MKTCFKCKTEKPLSQFYVHSTMKDGHLNKCITCTKLDASKTRTKNLKNTEWVKKERARCRNKMKAIRSQGLEQYAGRNITAARWRAKNRDKIKAETAANIAERKGLIRKIELCESCGGSPTEKHHPDYRHPLKVVYLCKPCHGKTRRKK